MVRTEATGNAASRIAAVPEVRRALLDRQRAYRRLPGLVADGRDMGTVVFPDADLKFFMIASIKERARRRQKELGRKGIQVGIGELMREIEERDRRDTEREHSPLMKASDAVEIDTTRLSIDEQVELILDRIHKKRGGT